MANTTINQSLVNKLAGHLRKDGSDDDATVAELLGIKSALVAAYKEALAEKFPLEFGLADDDDGLGADIDLELGDPEPEAPKPAPVAAKPTPAKTPPLAAPKRFLLRNEAGLDTQLEVIAETSKAVVLGIPKVRIPVTVILKGKTVDLDLAELRTLPGNAERHGFPVARLIELAEAALA